MAKKTQPPPASPPMRVAVIDVGSDTIHLLVVDVLPGADGPTLCAVDRRAELVELGREVGATGSLSDGTIKAVIKLAAGFAKPARKSGGVLVMAATEAIRQASNGGALMDRLSEAIGVPVRLLSGDVEAELSFLGARSWMEREGCQVFIDSGGGSTEVVIADGQRLRSKVSIAVGAASLAQRISGDPPRPLGYGLAAVRVGQLIAALPEGKPESAVATGGSAHNLAKLDPRHPRQRRLSLKELDARTKDLMAVPAAVLARRSGEDPRRVRLLAPGGLILAAVLEHYHLDSMLVAPAGLREGIALAYHASPESWWRGGSAPAAAVRPSHAL